MEDRDREPQFEVDPTDLEPTTPAAAAMALTANLLNSKYKETSEGGLAVSVVLC